MVNSMQHTTAPTIRCLTICLAGFAAWVGAADVKVACVGNSITAGMGIASNQAYPAKLDSILGTGYQVTNHGNSGKTMIRAVNDAYWKQPQFGDAISSSPGIVIIELGTNDSKDYIWPSYKQDFKRDYRAMVDTFRHLSSKPEVWICLQPWANNPSWGMFDAVIDKQVNPLIQQVAMEAGIPLVDLRTGMNGHPEWLQSDSVHPNAAGAKGMASIIGTLLKRPTITVAMDASLEGGLHAPQGFGFQWYRNDTLLAGETAQSLKPKARGSYKVSVKIEANTQSRLVSRPTLIVAGMGMRTPKQRLLRVGPSGRLELSGSGALQVRLSQTGGREVDPLGKTTSGTKPANGADTAPVGSKREP